MIKLTGDPKTALIIAIVLVAVLLLARKGGKKK